MSEAKRGVVMAKSAQEIAREGLKDILESHDWRLREGRTVYEDGWDAADAISLWRGGDRIALLWESEAWEMLCKAIDLLHDVAEMGSIEGIQFPTPPRTCSS